MTSIRPEPPKAAPRMTAPSKKALWGRLCGAAGSVLVASTPLTFLLAGWGPLAATKLFLGITLVGTYVATNPDFLTQRRDRRAKSLLALSFSTTFGVFALVALLNVYLAHHPKEIDFTREKLYTLGPESLRALHDLKTPVTVMAFFRSDEDAFNLVSTTLHRYALESDQLHIEMVNPLARPDLVKKYAITERSARIVVTAAGKEARAKGVEEEDLINAITKAVQQGHATISFLTGHGEGDLKEAGEAEGFAAFEKAIEADGYAIDTLNLLSGSPEEGTDAPGSAHQNKKEPQALEVPSHVQLLVVLSPQHHILQPEIAAIERFLNRGGRLLVFEEAQVDSGLKELLRNYNVEIQDDLIVDTNPIGRLLGLGVASPLMQPTSANHAITRGLSGMVMKTARSLRVGTKATQQTTAVPLAETGSTAWGETQLKQGGTIARDDDDHPPPLYTAMAVTQTPLTPEVAEDKDKTPPGARLVVFGDSDWVSNGLIGLQSNEDLALNTLAWLLEESDRITIRPRTRAHSQLSLSGDDLVRLKFYSMDIVPVLLVAIGLAIVVARRQR